ncbi:restriction endonuclease subunit S [Pseudomonas lalucatii]|nr:restriction endonuclease subunit S [Pseudomonas lalucatii]
MAQILISTLPESAYLATTPIVASYFTISRKEIRERLEKITTGQAYPQLSLKQVRELVLELPPLAEQNAIANVLSEMAAELASLEARRDKIRQLKQGMMEELLTGRIRLV